MDLKPENAHFLQSDTIFRYKIPKLSLRMFIDIQKGHKFWIPKLERRQPNWQKYSIGHGFESLPLPHFFTFDLKMRLISQSCQNKALVCMGFPSHKSGLVPWNHSVFKMSSMEPLGFWKLVKWNQPILRFAPYGTTRFKFIEPGLQTPEKSSNSLVKDNFKAEYD